MQVSLFLSELRAFCSIELEERDTDGEERSRKHSLRSPWPMKSNSVDKRNGERVCVREKGLEWERARNFIFRRQERKLIGSLWRLAGWASLTTQHTDTAKSLVVFCWLFPFLRLRKDSNVRRETVTIMHMFLFIGINHFNFNFNFNFPVRNWEKRAAEVSSCQQRKMLPLWSESPMRCHFNEHCFASHILIILHSHLFANSTPQSMFSYFPCLVAEKFRNKKKEIS